MSEVLAIIPARSGSKGVPGKNFKAIIDERSPVWLAVECARCLLPTDAVIITTDAVVEFFNAARVLKRPSALAQDDTPMIDVIKHVLQEIPGPPEQIIVLLQPTQPLRKPEHIQQAIALLHESKADSVVSVVHLPFTHSPKMHGFITTDGRLRPYMYFDGSGWPSRRQDVEPTFIRDGTCYVFRRATVATHGNIYGQDVRPLIIDPNDTCPLDTEFDWLEAERRLRDREGVKA